MADFDIWICLGRSTLVENPLATKLSRLWCIVQMSGTIRASWPLWWCRDTDSIICWIIIFLRLNAHLNKSVIIIPKGILHTYSYIKKTEPQPIIPVWIEWAITMKGVNCPRSPANLPITAPSCRIKISRIGIIEIEMIGELRYCYRLLVIPSLNVLLFNRCWIHGRKINRFRWNALDSCEDFDGGSYGWVRINNWVCC